MLAVLVVLMLVVVVSALACVARGELRTGTGSGRVFEWLSASRSGLTRGEGPFEVETLGLELVGFFT
jgi:hypothetical protein